MILTPPPRPGLQWPRRLDPLGERGPTKNDARGADWRRSSRGCYVRSHIALTVEQRILEAGFLLPRQGAVQGWSALRWLGGQWFTGEDNGVTLPVQLAVGRWDLRRQPGFAVSFEQLDPGDVVITDGLAHSTAVVAVCFEMRHALDVHAAVRAVDMACYDDLVSLDEVRHHLMEHTAPRTGLRLAEEALALADENAWSPPECDTRLTWRSTKLPPVLTNQPVFDLAGNHLGTPDLLEPLTGTAVEYNGGPHFLRRRQRRDRDRDERLRAVGIYSTVVMAGDPPGRTAERMVALYRRQLASANRDRAWTLVPPAWWVPTLTVAQRRALSPAQRERWLRHRQLSRPIDDRTLDEPA